METFVVRVWRPAHGVAPDADAPADPDDIDLRGTILHPATGKERPFTNEAELLDLLRHLCNPP